MTAATLIAAWLREPRRRDLVVFSGLLVVGVVADAVLGAFVVYSKLNPWLVSLHLLLSLAMVVVGAVLYHRSKYVYGPGARADVRDAHFLLIARLLWIPFTVVLVAGTSTTGSGPHAGASQGQLVARRLPFALLVAAWMHSAPRCSSSGWSPDCSSRSGERRARRAAPRRAPPRPHLTGAGGDRR